MAVLTSTCFPAMSFSQSLTSVTAKRFFGGLVVALVGMVIFLLTQDTPWEGEVARTIRRGRPLEVIHYVQIGLWWAGLGLAVLLAILIASFPLCWKWSEREPAPVAAKQAVQRWETLVVVAAFIVACFLRIPLADQGLRWDEHDNLRRNFHGFTALDAKTEADQWRPAGMREAVFENDRGNNPFLYSTLAHLSLDTWRAISGVPRDRFNVVAMRIPALLAGLGGILTLWLLARRMGGPLAAAIAIWLVTLHPLHINYSVEARGYSLVLLLAPVFLSAVWNVLQRGTWADAFATAFTAAAILFSFPGALYYIGVAGIGLALALLWKGNGNTRATLLRLVIAGSLALGVLVFLLAPALLQAFKTLDSQFAKTGLPAPWFFQTWHWNSVGVHLPGDQAYYDLRDGKLAWSSFLGTQLQTEPMTLLMSLGIIPLMAVLGIRQWWKGGTAERVVLAITIGAPLLCVFHHGVFTKYAIFQWYMIYSLPAFAALLGSGVASLKPFGQSAACWQQAILPCVFLGLFLKASYPNAHFRRGSYTPWDIDHGSPTARTIMKRGPNTWETWQDGRVLRLPRETPAAP
jgi:hypothetical protein